MVFTALTAVAVAVSGDGDFRITSVAPRNRSGSVAEGGTFTLECSVSKSIRSCVWQHRDRSRPNKTPTDQVWIGRLL